ncbi:hypothetical protein [Paenarthrobacter nicotinovorans]|uniref:hypothetical protein n=1 Tax=Paenarthrobacter nicotinovorans TaxID=29320 RepID=UPI00047D1B7C|nr:hypothetical protein [Paenarthrobacter nicotinovorans]
MSAETSLIVVKVKDAASVDRELEHASAVLREKATPWGLLVTRVDFATYTVALSPEIPLGVTRELDLL